jgi:hypothetical protein
MHRITGIDVNLVTQVVVAVVRVSLARDNDTLTKSVRWAQQMTCKKYTKRVHLIQNNGKKLTNVVQMGMRRIAGS